MEWLVISSIIAAFATAASGLLQSSNERQNQQHAEWYNSPKHQMELYQAAGINPYMATGGFQPISSPAPSSGGANALSGLASVFQSFGQTVPNYEKNRIQELNVENNINKLELENTKWQLLSQQVKQALRRGEVQYAMDLLGLDLAQRTQEDKVNISHSNASIFGSNAAIAAKNALISDYEQATYKDYRDSLINEIKGRTATSRFMRNSYYPSMLKLYAQDRVNQRLHYNLDQEEFQLDMMDYQLKEAWQNARIKGLERDFWETLLDDGISAAIRLYGARKRFNIK